MGPQEHGIMKIHWSYPR